jgi:hypothetical protein
MVITGQTPQKKPVVADKKRVEADYRSIDRSFDGSDDFWSERP